MALLRRCNLSLLLSHTTALCNRRFILCRTKGGGREIKDLALQPLFFMLLVSPEANKEQLLILFVSSQKQ